jgi:hypothetical protein
LKKKFLKKISKSHFQDILKYVEKNQPKLWGRNKGRNFLSNSLLVTLYKDITHSGNQKLVKKTDHLLGISSKSIGKNAQRIRKVVA